MWKQYRGYKYKETSGGVIVATINDEWCIDYEYTFGNTNCNIHSVLDYLIDVAPVYN